MARVKICGLTRMEDVEYLNELMPYYAGFVFAKSKRNVSPKMAAKMAAKLHPSIRKVGVFVDEEHERVIEIANICNLDVLQFHGSESSGYCGEFKGYEVWKSFGIENREDGEPVRDSLLGQMYGYRGMGVLLDTSCNGSCGGSGKTFDWNGAKNVSSHFFTVLAGGITPENVVLAMETVRPNVIDVSSGVETEGVKDFEKIKKLIENVRG